MTTATIAVKGPSSAQMPPSWRLFARAWIRHATRADIRPSDTAAKEAWRRELLFQHAGVTSTKALNQDTFESVMLALASEADDTKQIGYWTSCIERRYRHLIKESLQECSRLNPDTVYDWFYVRDVYAQSQQLPVSIFEAPAPTLKKVFQMLDTHRRRLDRHRREHLEEAPF
jgi:hypothetical protein